ncbi:MAG TPA: hypothetical protein VE818_06145 [Nitrososphaeraceae archaeon]|nr:hypothetical protein [Nitrososphaeraceae archaeon]
MTNNIATANIKSIYDIRKTVSEDIILPYLHVSNYFEKLNKKPFLGFQEHIMLI